MVRRSPRVAPLAAVAAFTLVSLLATTARAQDDVDDVKVSGTRPVESAGSDYTLKEKQLRRFSYDNPGSRLVAIADGTLPERF